MTDYKKELTKEEILEMMNQPIQFKKPTLIKVSKEFRFNGSGLWLGMETTCPFGQEIEEFKKANQLLNDAFHAMNPGYKIEVNPEFAHHLHQPIPTIDLAFQREKENTEISMDNATTQDELADLFDKAVEYHLTDHYEKRLKELS